MAIIDKLTKFNETAGLIIYQLIGADEVSQFNGNKIIPFNKYINKNLHKILKAAELEMTEFFSVVNSHFEPETDSVCANCTYVFLRMFDIHKLFKDYLKAYADHEGGVKNGDN